jgi:heme A synthase
VYVHLGWALVIIAAIRLIKYAIDNNDRWWRLIIIILVLAGIALGAMWALGRSGWQLDRGLGAAPVPSTVAAQVLPRSSTATPPAAGDAARYDTTHGLCRKPRNAGWPPISSPHERYEDQAHGGGDGRARRCHQLTIR